MNAGSQGRTSASPRRRSVSLVVPAYNEAAIIESALRRLCEYMRDLERDYDWELIVVDDGSSDGTAELAARFAERRPNVLVLRHQVNFHLGQALRYAFRRCRGDYIVTMDCDLSYAPWHIERMLTAIQERKARIVLASVFMEGGRITNVPWERRLLSQWANRFLGHTAKGDLATLTAMVRCYDRRFLSKLSLRAEGTDINTEVIYKAQLLGARIVEIPAHIDWTSIVADGPRRPSAMKLQRSAVNYLQAGFLFRPSTLFLVPGLVLLLLGGALASCFGWRVLDATGGNAGGGGRGLGEALEHAFDTAPHLAVGAAGAMLVAIQLVVAGLLALQNRRYFEDLYDLGVTVNVNTAREAVIDLRTAPGWSPSPLGPPTFPGPSECAEGSAAAAGGRSFTTTTMPRDAGPAVPVGADQRRRGPSRPPVAELTIDPGASAEPPTKGPFSARTVIRQPRKAASGEIGDL